MAPVLGANTVFKCGAITSKQGRYTFGSGRGCPPSLSCRQRSIRQVVAPVAVWTRPGQDPGQGGDWIKPSYVPQPSPNFVPNRRDESDVVFPSAPEFKPAELPEKPSELPSGPGMPERRPDPIPAGNPKEKPAPDSPDKREKPPGKDTETKPDKR